MSAYNIPQPDEHGWARFVVPSQGLFYGGKLPEGLVGIRRSTTQEEAILSAQGMDFIERVQAVMRTICRLPEGIKPQDLLITDRIAILLVQRCLTYGPIHEFTASCRFCRRSMRHKVNVVEDLAVVSSEDVATAAAEEGRVGFANEEPFTVELPHAKAAAKCRFLRGTDEAAIVKQAKGARVSLPRALPGDPAYYATLIAQIVSIDTLPEWANWRFDQKEQWLRQMSGGDAARIRGEVDFRESGIDTRLTVNCPGCNSENVLRVPIDLDFFLPSVS